MWQMETEGTSPDKSYIRFLLSCQRKINDCWKKVQKKAGMNISEYLLQSGAWRREKCGRIFETVPEGSFIRQITGIATMYESDCERCSKYRDMVTRDILAVKQEFGGM